MKYLSLTLNAYFLSVVVVSLSACSKIEENSAVSASLGNICKECLYEEVRIKTTKGYLSCRDDRNATVNAVKGPWEVFYMIHLVDQKNINEVALLSKQFNRLIAFNQKTDDVNCDNTGLNGSTRFILEGYYNDYLPHDGSGADLFSLRTDDFRYLGASDASEASLQKTKADRNGPNDARLVAYRINPKDDVLAGTGKLIKDKAVLSDFTNMTNGLKNFTEENWSSQLSWLLKHKNFNEDPKTLHRSLWSSYWESSEGSDFYGTGTGWWGPPKPGVYKDPKTTYCKIPKIHEYKDDLACPKISDNRIQEWNLDGKVVSPIVLDALGLCTEGRELQTTKDYMDKDWALNEKHADLVLRFVNEAWKYVRDPKFKYNISPADIGALAGYIGALSGIATATLHARTKNEIVAVSEYRNILYFLFERSSNLLTSCTTMDAAQEELVKEFSGLAEAAWEYMKN